MREAFDRGADYAWLFNNDAVTDPDTLDRLIEPAGGSPDRPH